MNAFLKGMSAGLTVGLSVGMIIRPTRKNRLKCKAADMMVRLSDVADSLGRAFK